MRTDAENNLHTCWHVIFLVAFLGYTTLPRHVTQVDTLHNDRIHLAIGPTCGILSTNGSVADVNAGLGSLSTSKTIVSFGDSFTCNGKYDGSTPDLPLQKEADPKYGNRFTNGYVWVENLAKDTGAHLLDYAVSGAVTNTTIWPSKSDHSSFVEQVSIFQSQSFSFDPSITLYSVF
ncbi:hypothetical protein FRC08_010872, partial [Ceratobasidium sp. 394]